MENDLVTYRKPMTAVEVRAQVQLIQEVMKAVMEKDVHYGVIPGTTKPTLYKPGSEKILSTFRIAAHPKEIEDLSTPDEIRYRVKVYGVAMEDDHILFGVGIGECSSNEAKYKWRMPVCDEEFNETPEDRKRLIWKKGYQDKPNYQQKQIRTNPSDVANTILKMAKKRAQIDMTLTATAASDVFDQDLEDLPEGIVGEVADKKPPITAPQKKATAEAVKKVDGVSVTVGIKGITHKDGTKKDGQKFRKYTIVGNDGNSYGTFDETFADLANTSIKNGSPVTIIFTTSQYGNDIKSLELVNREPGAEG